MVWIDPWWGLVRAGFQLDTTGPFYVLDKQYGPWFWVHFTHSYSLNFLSIFLLTQVLTNKSNIYKRQAFFLLTCVSMVVITNLLYVLGLSPVTDYDVTPIVFSFVSALMFWGIYSCHLFQLVPIAWEKVIEAMDTAVVVVKNSGQVVDANPAFCRMFEQNIKTSPLGMSLEEISTELATLSTDLTLNKGKHQEVARNVQGENRYYEVLISEIKDIYANVQGRVLAINDITQLKITHERLSIEHQELAVAAERTRFTQDLHDNLGQILGFCSVQLRAIERELGRENRELADIYLRRLGEVLSEAQHEMRSYVHGIRTREFERTRLTALVNKEITRLKEYQDYEVHLDIATCEFSVESKIQILGIVKEALNNIRKHSRANAVKISFRLANNNWVLAITDNGVGFEPNSTLSFSQGASGLSIMEERARLLGGYLQIDSNPGKTVIRVEFPRKEETIHAHNDC